MTDRELLEAAAKAAGISDSLTWTPGSTPWRRLDSGRSCTWNPLADDGDALRLAVKLRLHVDHHQSGVSAWVMSRNSSSATAERYEEDTGNDAADTRRAIVRAAASIARLEFVSA